MLKISVLKILLKKSKSPQKSKIREKFKRTEEKGKMKKKSKIWKTDFYLPLWNRLDFSVFILMRHLEE